MTCRSDLDASARAAKAGDLAVARTLLEQAMTDPEARQYAGRIERGRRYLILRGAYDEPWAPHPDWCAACFLGEPHTHEEANDAG